MTGGKGLNPALNPVKIEKYLSPLTVINNDNSYTFDVSNIFTGKPDIITVRLVWNTAAGGYAAGDVAYEKSFAYGDRVTGTAHDQGIMADIDKDFKTITVTVGSSVAYLEKSSFNLNSSVTNFDIEVFAIRFVVGDVPDITRVGTVPLEHRVVNNGDADIQFDLAKYANDYDYFELHFEQVRGASDITELKMRTSTDGGTTFDSGASDYYSSTYGESAGTSVNSNLQESSMRLSWQTTGTASAFEKCDGFVIIPSPAKQQITRCYRYAGGLNHAGARYAIAGNIERQSETDVTDIQIFASSGNLESGEFYLYGKRKLA